ncbi:MAG: VOC family protein [Firmicutes bacterium]|nr:VOC family protein [Bacillota bacterium]
MALTLFVNFNGNCREAVDFYTQVFGTEAPKFMTFGEAPPDPQAAPLPEAAKNLIMYTQLDIGGTILMFSDIFPGTPFVAGNNITLTVGSKDMEEIKTLFDKMKVGGMVTMELQETFWSKSFGSVIDKFGIPWMFSHDSGWTM